jgi:hypothetical protein
MQRGCDFCVDDSNLYVGRAEQIASDDEFQALLYRCPVD